MINRWAWWRHPIFRQISAHIRTHIFLSRIDFKASFFLRDSMFFSNLSIKTILVRAHQSLNVQFLVVLWHRPCLCHRCKNSQKYCIITVHIARHCRIKSNTYIKQFQTTNHPINQNGETSKETRHNLAHCRAKTHTNTLTNFNMKPGRYANFRNHLLTWHWAKLPV